MASLTPQQLRAARALLFLQQEMLAHEAKIGITTLRLFENGNRVGQDIVDRLRLAIEEQGAVLVQAGTVVDGVATGGGVLLKNRNTLPKETEERLKSFEMNSSDAAPSSSKASGVGRRARTPISGEARDKFRKKTDVAPGGGDGTQPGQDPETPRTTSDEEAKRPESSDPSATDGGRAPGGRVARRKRSG